MSDYTRINNLKKQFKYEVNNIEINDLFLKDEVGKSFLEYIIESKIKITDDKIINYISNNYNILRYTFNKKYFLPSYSNINLLFDSSKGTCLLDELLENDIYSFSLLPLDILVKLFQNDNYIYLIEKVYIKDINIFSKILNRINDTNILYKFFKKINRIDLMKYININNLLNNNPDGIMILDELLSLGVEIHFNGINNYKLAEILYNKGLYNYILEMDCKMLLNYPNPSNNYLNLILQRNYDLTLANFKNIKLSSSDSKSLAISTLILLKNGTNIINIKDLTDFNYKSNEKPAILHMLELDKVSTKRFIEVNNLEKDLKEFISKFNSIQLSNFNIDNINNYLPSIEKLIKRINNHEINKITEKDIFIDDLIKPINNEITLLDYVINNNINIDSIIYYLSKNIKAILILLKNNIKPFIVDEKLLYENINNDKKLIDLLIEKGCYDCIEMSAKTDLRIIDYSIKYKNFNFINKEIFNQLLLEDDGKFLIEKYLNNNDFIDNLKPDKIETNKLIELYNKGYKKIFINANEKQLLTEYNNKTILDDLLISNITPTFKNYDFSSLKTMNILINNKRQDLMYNADLNILINYPSSEKNYLQYLINCYKKGINVNFEKKNLVSNNKKLIAKYYIQMYKNDLWGFLDFLNEKDLIDKGFDGKSLLYHLIKLDAPLTINKILEPNLLARPNIFLELKLAGYNKVSIDLKYDNYNCDDIIRSDYNNNYSSNIKSTSEDLLNELRDLFINDKKSDKELIDALISSYRFCISKSPIFIEEVKKLINIKKQNPNLYYTKALDSGYFNPNDGVIVEDSIISVLNHETGHVLHYYLQSANVPNEYYDIVSKIIKNPDSLKKVEKYSEQNSVIREKIANQAKKIISNYIPNKLEEKQCQELVDLLKLSVDDLKKIYKDKGYSDETLDIIFSTSINLSNAINQKKTIKRKELIELIMRYDYDSFLAIGDILDAIYDGKLCSGLIKSNDDKKIITSGHGVKYYSIKERGFIEMVANYSAIIKSKKSKEAIEILRYIVGDELVDFLEYYYNVKILNLFDIDYSGRKSWMI